MLGVVLLREKFGKKKVQVLKPGIS